MGPIDKVIHSFAENLKSTGGFFTKFFAAIGIVTTLSLLSVGIVRIAPEVIERVSQAAVSLSGRFVPAPKLILEASKYSVPAGEVFTLEWTFDKQSTETEGSYLFSYPCAENMHLEFFDTIKKSFEVAYCNTYVQTLPQDNKIQLKGFVNPRDPLLVPITLYFTKNGSPTITARSTVEITFGGPASAVEISSTPSPNRVTTVPTRTTNQNTSVQTTRTSNTTVYQTIPNNPYGKGIDLTARIIGFGTVSTTTNEFIQKNSIHYLERGAIKFVIENVGDKTSNEWTFSLVLPTFPEYVFMSDMQQPLSPGDKIEYVIAFDSVKREEKPSFVINVDNTSSVNDTNRSNNIKRDNLVVDLR